MERLTLTHVNGPGEGRSFPLDHFPLVVGSLPESDILVPEAAARHARIERAENGDLILRDAGSDRGTFLAGQRVREAVLRYGDVFELGHGGPQVRLDRRVSPRDTLVEAVWKRPGGRPSTMAAAFRRYAPVLSRSAPLRWALLFLVLAIPGYAVFRNRIESQRLAAEVGIMRQAMQSAEDDRRRFFAAIEAERSRNEAQTTALDRELQAFRDREATLSHQLSAQADETVRHELETTRERIQSLESERAVGEHIIREFGAGVCLIQGSYAYYDGNGRPLRHRLDEKGHKLHDDDGQPSLGVDGQGAIYTVDYFGTGFLVDRRGLVLSNRHVAVPWWDDDKAEELKKDGYQARFVLFRAFFPKEKEPFELDPLRHSENVDLAVLKIDLRGRKIPVLPLDHSGDGAIAGQPVVVVGYPTGLEAILAKADNDVVQTILKRYGRQSEHVTEALSDKGLIRPSTTQGHIGDVTTTDIVFDAPTTQGGSGGPVFNRTGQVVAIEYAVLPKFGGTAFGIPIHYAVDLMRAVRKNDRG
jgi:S1-C subfamily serine protease